MCGIAGYTGVSASDDIKKMIDKINYRGPDAQITFQNDQISLAHARLSILDLRTEGNQPMYSKDGRFIIVFNGEIYNFKALQHKHIPEVFLRTETDTEVVLELYIKLGPAMLNEIRGMFAIAIFDQQKSELFLARDRMGKKPLYYFQNKDHFIFASELKSILAHSKVPHKLNLQSLNRYLSFDYVPGQESIAKDIYKLNPGHYMLITQNNINTYEKFWSPVFLPKSNFNFDEAVTQLDQLLDEACKERMMSDVPLGVFLSGGLDSSTVAYYTQKNAQKPIQTFSIGFEDLSYDESNYARAVAKHLGTDHYEQKLGARETLQLIDEIYPLVDEPFADASLIPTYFLSKFTRTKVTVALGGDGSDELLAGYPTFITERYRSIFNLFPKSIWAMAEKSIPFLFKPSDKNISLDFKLKQLLRGFSGTKAQTHQLWLGSFNAKEKQSLFNKDIYQELIDPSGLSLADEIHASQSHLNQFDQTTLYYIQTYLVDDILVKVDRASMYNSLEVRAPFMDQKLVEFLLTLPQSFKQKGNEGKYILKKLMENKLPQDIIYRPKKGFGIPLSDWIRKDLRNSIEETLLSPQPFFNRDYIQKILNEHLQRKQNHRKLIWNLYMFLRFSHHFPSLEL